VVCFRYGQFSHLWIDQAQRLGLDVVVLEEEWGRGANEARLEEVLKADTEKKIKAVMVVHNETTTGVTSDIHGCRKAIVSRLRVPRGWSSFREKPTSYIAPQSGVH
jgi:alanine-glyoxylate transaminase/serine-glyoxylate transaminase/serine-pyruvate transaminase